MQNANQKQHRYLAIIPWYINGTASKAEHEWVEHYLATHPEARGELEWQRSLKQQIASEIDALPADIGLARLQEMVRKDSPRQQESSLKRLWSYFLASFATPAFALAMGVILAQAGIIGSMLLHRPNAEPVIYRSLGGAPGTYLRVMFKQQATEVAIRKTLLLYGATIVYGPNQLGEYWIDVPADKRAAFQSSLERSGLIEASSIDQVLPTKE